VAASHYDLLEVQPQADAGELRRAFRSLSKRYHPDTTSLPEAEAREAFRRLQLAYGTLSDPDRRRAYDASLLLLGSAAPQLPTRRLRVEVPQPVRRPLSGGEWFALLLLVLAVLFSLVLGVGLAWARGTALITRPSWLSEPLPEAPAAADVAVDPPGQAPQPAGIRQAP